MQIGSFYYHLNGFEWIQYHKPEVWQEIVEIISSINAEDYRTKVSKEKTMKGKMLFSPIELNNRLKNEFKLRGWEEKRFNYFVTDDYDLTLSYIGLSLEKQKEILENAGKVPILSYNQTDFVKDRIALEVQLAKYSFIEFDLFVKHLGFFIGNTIDVGIEMVPTKNMQSQMSSGPGYFERTIHHLARQGRGAPAVPLVLLGLEP